MNLDFPQNMYIKKVFRSLLREMGYDILKMRPTNHPIARRRQLLDIYQIDLVLDVGANVGQYALQLRHDIKYNKNILSFEPLTDAFEVLEKHASKDPFWQTLNFALGDCNQIRDMNIAGNSYSSSFLPMLASHEQAAPESKYIGKAVIEIKTLDSIFTQYCKIEHNIYLKIDTQGFESKVLQGAAQSLKCINTIQMEMSLIPLYKGEVLFFDMCAFMREKGYTLVALEDGFSDPKSGQLLQVDGIFHRF